MAYFVLGRCTYTCYENAFIFNQTTLNNLKPTNIQYICIQKIDTNKCPNWFRIENVWIYLSQSVTNMIRRHTFFLGYGSCSFWSEFYLLKAGWQIPQIAFWISPNRLTENTETVNNQKCINVNIILDAVWNSNCGKCCQSSDIEWDWAR